MSSSEGMIECLICGEKTHAIQIHLRDHHSDWTVAKYQERFPGAALLSETAKKRLADRAAQMRTAAPAAAASPVVAEHAVATEKEVSGKRYFHEVFGLGPDAAARNARGEPIPLSVITPEDSVAGLIPDADPNHVWDVEVLKNVLMAFELSIPLYVWGHMGTGKTTDLINVCARTGRPAIRVQHTMQTEESHILGQWLMKNKETVYNLGPLPYAMKYGLTYIADEYDFGNPGVMAVYQPILEPGGVLIIKDADPENRVIRPHPNFRFAATGNTNGSGDESGLYQGTQIQNAANYDRFGMVIQKAYMAPALETQIVANQAGIGRADAAKLVDFAGRVREAFEAAKISNTCSPRTLINAAKIGVRRGSMRTGLALSFGNKLNKVDREVVDAIAQRIFS